MQRPAGEPGIFTARVKVEYSQSADEWTGMCQFAGLLVKVVSKSHDECVLKLHYAASGAFDGISAQWRDTQEKIAREFTEPQGLIKAV